MAALLQASAYSGDANNIREILESGTVGPDAADSVSALKNARDPRAL